METAHASQKSKRITGSFKMLPLLLLTALAVACSLNLAMAQTSNLSDWNVPPPLPPGNRTKGVTVGKAAKVQPIVLSLTDIPPAAQPRGPAAQLPALAAISSTAPFVDQPGQPAISNVETGLPEIPLPGMPDAMPTPKQALQDAPITMVTDPPLPVPPEMPPFPPEPAPSGQKKVSNGPIPLMPGVVSLPVSSPPQGSDLIPWSVPGIPENTNFEFNTPGVEKGAGNNNKSKQKNKHRSLKN